jgi:flagellar basal-body rod protein FlgG
MVAHQVKLDILANNLANAETPGFKANCLSIDPAEAGSGESGGRANPTERVQAGRIAMDSSEGAIRPSGNPLDFAIIGSGMFVVQTPQGERYTRAGNFTRDGEGYLATAQGYRVLGSDGPIRVPADGLRLEANGRLAGGGSFRIVLGPEGQGMGKIGGNLFAPAEGAGAPPAVSSPSILQGQVESSNVNVVMTMVEMLATLRSYEAYQRTIQAADQIAGAAVNELGRV